MGSKERTFEEAMKELQNTLEMMEKGEDSLDKNIEHFKRGLELAKACQKRLNEAELSVKKIEESGGMVKEVPAPELDDEND